MEELAIFAVVVPLIIGIRIGLHFVDKNTIKTATQAKGWSNVVIAWSPLAPGALFEKGERSYLVTYTDESGEVAERYCKTSIMTGVFWRD